MERYLALEVITKFHRKNEPFSWRWWDDDGNYNDDDSDNDNNDDGDDGDVDKFVLVLTIRKPKKCLQWRNLHKIVQAKVHKNQTKM